MRRNWSGNITFEGATLEEPSSIEELQRVVARGRHVRVVGAGHSFNNLIGTSNTLISLRRLNRLIGIDPASKTVTFEGGIRLHELAEQLHWAGYALATLPSLPHFSVVGACATATHGSGDANRCLAAAVRGMEIVTADGDLVQIPTRDLAATAVGLGAFGVVARMTLAVEASFSMAQEIHLEMPLANAIEQLDEIMASAYSVSYFTQWQEDHIEQVWRKYRLKTEEGPVPRTADSYLGARRADRRLGPDGPSSAAYMNEQLLVPGPWHERLPHVRAATPLPPGSQLQTEYFVARRYGREALKAIATLRPSLATVMRDSVMGEIRTVAADDLWLSPFAEDSLAVNFSWVNDWPAVEQMLCELEAALEPFEPRPHWGKLYSLGAKDLRARYPRFDDFRSKTREYDQCGKFLNAHLDRLFDA